MIKNTFRKDVGDTREGKSSQFFWAWDHCMGTKGAPSRKRGVEHEKKFKDGSASYHKLALRWLGKEKSSGKVGWSLGRDHLRRERVVQKNGRVACDAE